MRGIGEVSRASGLGVSALRFYDRAGVLVPAEVDAATGYRRYSDAQIRAARLVAGLRRVGMPVAGIARAVAALDRPELVRALLDEHLSRLEDGLADARRELSRLHQLLGGSTMTTITLPAAELAAALDFVRFAAGADPELPMINGVLVEADEATITLVATDRYRLAVASAGATVSGPPVRVVAPLPFADALRPLLTGDVTLTVAGALDVGTSAGRLSATPLDVDFPDYRRLTELPAANPRRIAVDPAALRATVTAAATDELAVLAVDEQGAVRTVTADEWAADPAGHVAVNREFLLQALDAGGPGQLELHLDGPIKPLVLRGGAGYSLLMPVREERSAGAH
ncbi:DNA polymerase III subunit beta family protein [Actinoplanes sp. RD1]|uniref:DNA polymerase III subunit beta family protein n=1 Tax=Actinoplanes sp. RD1 TaxID=3064538 RepID=UPI0027423A18|nr:MerR family transcriptional regulator [Actinoplanes sp. RD1]